MKHGIDRAGVFLAISQVVAIASILIGAQFSVNSGNGRASSGQPDGSGALQARDAKGTSLGFCPLERTSVNAQVDGFGAEVTVVQRFKNELPQAIEAVYTFPLPNDAAVARMRIKVGSRIIEGVIKTRAQAKEIYDNAKTAGKTAALLDQERPNIFTQQVANIAPGATVDVEITYVHLLKYIDGEYEFSFPMVVGPRFLGNASDPAKIDPPRANRVGTNIGITVDIRAGRPLSAIRSLLHEIDQAPIDRAGTRVRLRKEDEIPNKDFILRFAATGAAIETAFLTHTDRRGGFFSLVVLPPKRPVESQITPREMIFVMDQSGSQSGFPIEKSKELTNKLIQALRPGDTFNVLGFSDSVNKLWPKPKPVSTENQSEAHQFVTALQANGGTQLRPAVISAFSLPADPRRLRMVIFNTDGFVGDEREILREIQLNRDSGRMFTFGIGNNVNRYLIDAMALEGRGDAEVVTLVGNADEAAARFAKRLASPVLTNVSAKFSGVKVNNVQPEALPDVFADRPIVIHGRYTGSGPGKVTIQGNLGGQRWAKTFDLSFVNNDAPAIPVLWARQQVGELDRLTYMSGAVPNPKDPNVAQIARLGLEFGLVTAQTSFVAVEERISNVGGKQQTIRVPVAKADMGARGLNMQNLVANGSVALILSGGRSNNSVAADSPVAHSTLDGKGNPAIRIDWKQDLFFRGHGVLQWQIFRDDVPGIPIGVVDGKTTSFLDTMESGPITYFKNRRSISELICDTLEEGTTTRSSPIRGRPHSYSIVAIYKLRWDDLPPGIKLGTAVGTKPDCVFKSNEAHTLGYATVLARPTLVAPDDNAKLSGFDKFVVTPSSNLRFPIRCGYVIQLCQSKSFKGNKVFTSAEVTSVSVKDRQIEVKARFPGDTFTMFLEDVVGAKNSQTKIWWRVGARNIEDMPGPVPDPATGLRYVFSEPRSFERP